MKVFISWSGDKSHKVAMIFREWLPSVIQSVEPYVSSEDIDKGARWSTDIAKELENSTFGILCVTKDNQHAPWLAFEAGALSKTVDKSYVNPFLFDIKRAEVDGPILQFQSTIYEKEDIKKLIYTLNKACGENGISENMLDKAFEVWYPTLESSFNELKDDSEAEQSSENDSSLSDYQTATMIEKILELSQDNQKLLRNPDTKVSDGIESLKANLDRVMNYMERNLRGNSRGKRFNMRFQTELLQQVVQKYSKEYSFFMIISMLKEDFPWIYNLGEELMKDLKSDIGIAKKREQINNFREIFDLTCEHPFTREMTMTYEEKYIFIKNVQHYLNYILKDIEFEIEQM